MADQTIRREEPRRTASGSVIRFIIRFVVAAIVLLVTSFLVPGFSVSGIWTAIIAALIISGIDHLIEMIFDFDASPFGRGISGFVVSAAIIYFTQFFVGNMSVSIWGAIIGALVIGIIEAILPMKFL